MQLSANDIGNAYYLGIAVKSEIVNVRLLIEKLKLLGLNKQDRKEAIKNVRMV